MPSDPFEFDEEFGPLTPRPRAQLGGGGRYGNPSFFVGSGGAGGIPPMPRVGTYPTRRDATINLTTNQFTEDAMPNQFINTEARALAAETLADKKTEGIRGKVLAAVDTLTELFKDVPDGSVFSFAKPYDGIDWHFAAIKSQGKWYSTGDKNALHGADDDDLITWAISLGIYGEEDLTAFGVAKEKPGIIEASATES